MPIDSILEGFSRNWWTVLLRGILTILFGLMAFMMPGVTLLTLAMLYGAYALVDGMLSIWFGANSRTWGLVLFGLVGIAVGIFTLYYPWQTTVALLFMIGFWAIVRGISEIVSAIRLRHEISNEWSMGLSGLVSIALGILFFARVGTGALAVAWLIGTYALISGILLVKLALRIRSLPARVDRYAKAA
jgi:uncharacterized membrane protein HdeD (DUF308 family)